MWKEIEVLEHESDMPSFLRKSPFAVDLTASGLDQPAVDVDGSRRNALEMIDSSKQRRFACP